MNGANRAMKFKEMTMQVKVLYSLTIGILTLGLGLSIALPLASAPKPTRSVASLAGAIEQPSAKHASSEALKFIEERAAIRAEEQRELREIMGDASADAQLRAEAGQRMMSLLGWIEQETTIEGVMRLRGYLDPVVTVHQDSANVMFRAERLTREQSAQLLELVSRETGLTGGNIKIIPIN